MEGGMGGEGKGKVDGEVGGQVRPKED